MDHALSYELTCLSVTFNIDEEPHDTLYVAFSVTAR